MTWKLFENRLMACIFDKINSLVDRTHLLKFDFESPVGCKCSRLEARKPYMYNLVGSKFSVGFGWFLDSAMSIKNYMAFCLLAANFFVRRVFKVLRNTFRFRLFKRYSIHICNIIATLNRLQFSQINEINKSKIEKIF